MLKKCFFCGSSDVVRNGVRGRKHLYKCKSCSRQFLGGRRDLEGMRYVHKIVKYKDVTIQMDTTYWGRDFGLMVIRDALRGKVLWHKYVHHGTIAQYAEGVDWLKRNGFRIYGVVIDGMKGLAQFLKPVWVQMCQFHQGDPVLLEYVMKKDLILLLTSSLFGC